MRLGKDTIVFSKNGESMCVGLLSQTYLQEIHAENVIVPIVSFKRIGQSNILTFWISKDKSTFMHLADTFIQSDLQGIQAIHVLSVCVFPGNWTHTTFCAANAMLYHWATETE